MMSTSAKLPPTPKPQDIPNEVSMASPVFAIVINPSIVGSLQCYSSQMVIPENTY